MKNIIHIALAVILLCGLVTVLGCESPIPDVSEAAVTGLWERLLNGKPTPEALVLEANGKCRWWTGDAWAYGKYGIDGNKINTTWEYVVDVVIDEHETFSLKGNKIRGDNEKPDYYYLRVATWDQIKDVDYPYVEDYTDN